MNKHMVISIVDDDGEVRGSLTSLLRSAGFRVRSFADATEFLAEGYSDTSCIVTDVHMPEMSGLELQAELRRRGTDIPVIVMSAFPSEDARAQAIDRGAVIFLAKPLDPDQLLQRLHSILDH